MRDGRDSRVVMMAAAVEDGGGGQQRRRQTMTVVDNIGMQDWAANYKRDGQGWAARDSGDTEWQ